MIVLITLIVLNSFSLPASYLHRNSMFDVLGIEANHFLNENISQFNSIIDKIPENITIHGNHRYWGHWGLYIDIPEEYISSYTPSEVNVMIEEWRKINNQLEDIVINSFGIPKGKESRALTNVLYSIHILDDYKDTLIDPLQDMNKLVSSIEKSIIDLYGKTSKEAIYCSSSFKSILNSNEDISLKVDKIKATLKHINISHSFKNELETQGIKVIDNLNVDDLIYLSSSLKPLFSYDNLIYEDNTIKVPLTKANIDEKTLEKLANVDAQMKLKKGFGILDENNNLIISDNFKTEFPSLYDEFYTHTMQDLKDKLMKNGYSENYTNEIVQWFMKEIDDNPEKLSRNISAIQSTKSPLDALTSGLVISFLRNFEGLIATINRDEDLGNFLSDFAKDTVGYGGMTYLISGIMIKGATKLSLIADLASLGFSEEFAILAFDGVKLTYGFMTGKGDINQLAKNLFETSTEAFSLFVPKSILISAGLTPGGFVYISGVVLGSLAIKFGVNYVFEKTKEMKNKNYVYTEDVEHLFPKGFLERTNNFFNLPEKMTFDNLPEKMTFENLPERMTFDNLPENLIFEDIYSPYLH